LKKQLGKKRDVPITPQTTCQAHIRKMGIALYFLILPFDLLLPFTFDAKVKKDEKESTSLKKNS
jgi:hypothetical protein